ncbi:hypothetical protein CCP4SC76_2300008 [Gammaproteobacteria bacterium]
MIPAEKPPIFVASVMKGGTWLIRAVLRHLTGLQPYEPRLLPGDPGYGDPEPIAYPPGHFFSWHSVITPAVAERLRQDAARTLFIVRNIYDLTVSVHHHLTEEVDADLGRGTGLAGYLGQFAEETRLALTISGFRDGHLGWGGLGPLLLQMQSMLIHAERHPALVISFERLTLDKPDALRRIAQFLNLTPTHQALSEVAQATDFKQMRRDAERVGYGASHFRHGTAGDHRSALRPWHRAMIRRVLEQSAPRLVELADSLDIAEILDDATQPLARRMGRSLPFRDPTTATSRQRRAMRVLAPLLSSPILPSSSSANPIGLARVLCREIRASTGGRIFLYGLNDVAEQLLTECQQYGVRICGVFDRHKHCFTQEVAGVPVLDPERLGELAPETVLVTALNPQFQAEISAFIQRRCPTAQVRCPGERETALTLLDTHPQLALTADTPPDVLALAKAQHRLIADETCLIDELVRAMAGASSPCVLFLADRVYFNQLRLAVALRRAGWRSLAVVLDPRMAEHQRPHFDSVFTLSLPGLLRGLTRFCPTAIHTQAWMTRYELPVLVDLYKAPETRHIVEFLDILSFFIPDETLEERLPALRLAWGIDYDHTRHAMQRACQDYLVDAADGVLFSGDEGHQRRLLPAERQDETRCLNFPSYPLADFFAEKAVLMPRSNEPWRLLFAGGIPPHTAKHPAEVYGDAQILPVLRQLLKAGCAVTVRNNPQLGGATQLARLYPEYRALANEYPGLEFLPGLHPWEWTSATTDFHFGLMLYDWQDSRIGDAHFATIVPTKFFAYLEAGLPVLVNSRFHAVCDLVHKYGIGLVVDPEEYARLPARLADCDDAQLRANVLHARDELAMDRQIHRLLNLYVNKEK